MTPQYAGLRTLHNDNKDSGFTVLGFPCNQFGEQEPGTDEEILEFAQTNFVANFPMFAKIEVNGDGACELYQELKRQKPGDITWNFEKFLVGGDGEVLDRFEPRTTPEEIGVVLAKYK